MYRPVTFQGATRPVSVGVTTTGPPVVNAGAVVGEFVLHENVICPELPSVTFTGVGEVGSQFFVIDPAIGTAGCVCCIRIDAATSPTATKTISESKLRTSFLHHRGSSSRHIRWVRERAVVEFENRPIWLKSLQWAFQSPSEPRLLRLASSLSSVHRSSSEGKPQSQFGRGRPWNSRRSAFKPKRNRCVSS